MKRNIFLGFCLVILTVKTFGQTVEGTIKDAKTNESLAYVNIGILAKATGTVTDINGHYSLTFNNNNTDSLKISMIGYQSQTYLLSDFIGGASHKNVMLQPAAEQLAEVKISAKKLKESTLGNTTQSKSTDAGFSSNKLGNEIGAIIKIKRSPTLLKQFNASLATAATDSVKLRLNFYSVKNDLPDKILQQQNIFVTLKKGDDKLTVDLTDYHLIVEDKFFVSLEWIQNSPGHGLMFSASLFSSPVIARETSQAAWEKIGLVGVGFNVLAAY